jgi:hypothetical protein
MLKLFVKKQDIFSKTTIMTHCQKLEGGRKTQQTNILFIPYSLPLINPLHESLFFFDKKKKKCP